MKAAVKLTRHGRARADLLVESIWTDGLAGVRHGARVAGFFRDFSCEEGMRGVDAGIEQRDGRAAAVVSGGPRLIAANQRHAIGKRRMNDLVQDRSSDACR